MGRNKLKLQTLIFDRKFFNDNRKIKSWVGKNGFVIDNRLKKPIMKFGSIIKVRQRNADVFVKRTFRLKVLDKGVKGLYGFLKR